MTTKSDFKNHVGKCKRIVKKYGLTKKLECAGFILPDGKMIDFCKKKKETQFDIDRTFEHFQMTKDFYPQGEPHEGIIPYLDSCKAIRIRKLPITTRIQAVHKPTRKQTEKLVQSVKGCDRLYLQRVDPTQEEDEGRYCETSLNNPKPLDIHQWIHKCWR